MAEILDPKLREEIKEEAENLCKICGRWTSAGEMHHVVKVSEEPLLRNCKTNIWWLCKECHGETETNPGFNRKLQKILQDQYFELFEMNKDYLFEEVVLKVDIPMKDLIMAERKGMIKSFFGLGTGENIVRFLMGGGLKE